MITAIAVDDEVPALRVIERFCQDISTIRLEKTFTRTGEALNYLRSFPVDLLFLDINMPALSGVDFYKRVKQSTMVIFTTAYSEYAVEGFNLSAIDYLLKPFTFERFSQAVSKANEYYQFTHGKSPGEASAIFIRADYAMHKIRVDDIRYIEALDDYVKIYTNESKPLVARMTIKAMVDKLPAYGFVRVHRSFIVPLARIDSVRNKVINVGGVEIPIGASYEAAFFERFGSDL